MGGVAPVVVAAHSTRPRRRPHSAPAAYKKATALCKASGGAVGLDAALFLLTSQPSLLAAPAEALARRIDDLSTALGLAPADVAELLTRRAALADLLPYKCARARVRGRRCSWTARHLSPSRSAPRAPSAACAAGPSAR